MDSSVQGKSIFKIDIPLLISRGQKHIRRIITLDVRLSNAKEKKEYLNQIRTLTTKARIVK